MKRVLLAVSSLAVACATGEDTEPRSYLHGDAQSTEGTPPVGGAGGGTADGGGEGNCANVVCNDPPPPTCADEDHRRDYQSPGTCQTDGTCSYPTADAYCSFGCAAGACNTDPCASVSCTNPPPNYCKDSEYLVVFEDPGKCTANGGCEYVSTEVYCAFGCDASGCMNDPCAGVLCESPPANHCKDAVTARVYASPGACSQGNCSYQVAEIACPFGCTNGLCLNCQVGTDCPTGQWCETGTCVACTTSQHCGASCTDCTALGQVCSGGQCVACVDDNHCGSGFRCTQNVCVPCDTDLHCGASCTACASGSSCVGGSCSPCDTVDRCGSTCTPCSAATPYCRPNGTASSCVACLESSHCPSEQVCNPNTNTCGPPCSPTLATVFADGFATPNSTTYTSGSDASIPNSGWRVYTSAQHGVRIEGGRLQITNRRGSSSPDHGQGYAYVKTAGTGSGYDPSYQSVLKQNTAQEVVWTFNMRRDNPEGTSSGFTCSSTSSQNYITLGLAYVLATDSAGGLQASAGTCSPSATSVGYAVVLGGSNRLRLVRFTQGLRNGTLTDIVESGTFTITNYFSVRVTYRATDDLWRLEVRNDGTSNFAVPTGGSAYSFSGTGTDATYVNIALDYSGPYFQSGCTGLCSAKYTALFDNVSVGLRCAN